MINGLLHFFFSSKKKLFCIQEYKKPISLAERKKMLRDSARLFLCSPRRLLYFAALLVSFLPVAPKVLNFINLSSTGLCIGCWCLRANTKKRRICKSHKLWLKLPLCNYNEKRFANRSLITDKAKALLLFFYALNKKELTVETHPSCLTSLRRSRLLCSSWHPLWWQSCSESCRRSAAVETSRWCWWRLRHLERFVDRRRR